MNWYLDVLKNKYALFEGRARRQEYWMFMLFNIIVFVVLDVLMMVLADSFLGKVFGILYLLYWLAVLCPGIAVGVRRLHDTNRSGWWMLLGIVPLANIALLVFMCLDSTPGNNDHGPNPKGE